MKKTLSLAILILLGFTVQAQVGSAPNYANKTGGFGIGASSTLGSTKYETPEYDQIEKTRFNACGLILAYNLLNFVTLNGVLGYSNEISNSDDGEAEWGWGFSGWQYGLTALFPILGTNTILTPNCGSNIVVSPYAGFRIQKGTDSWYYDGPGGFGDYDEEADFTKTYINVGTRVEYFLPQFLGLNSSIQLNLNLLGTSNTKYDKKDFEDEDNTGLYFFDSSSTFGMAGFTVWFN